MKCVKACRTLHDLRECLRQLAADGELARLADSLPLGRCGRCGSSGVWMGEATRVAACVPAKGRNLPGRLAALARLDVPLLSRPGPQHCLNPYCRPLRCPSHSGWAAPKSRRRSSSGGLAGKRRGQGAPPAGAVRVKAEHWEDQEAPGEEEEDEEEASSADEEPWEAEEAEVGAAKRRRSAQPGAEAGGKPRGHALVGARVQLFLESEQKHFTGTVAEYLPGG